MTKLCTKILVKSDSAIESAFPLLYLLYLLAERKGIKKEAAPKSSLLLFGISPPGQ